MAGNNNFGAALGAFFAAVADADLAVAAQPLRGALTSIIANPSPSNVAAQGAVLAVALPAALPNVEATTASALATEGLALLNKFLPPPT
jgi:hypothetical protein